MITGPDGGPAGPWTLGFAEEFNVAFVTPWGTGPNPNVWGDHFQQGDLGRTNNLSEYEWYPHGYYGSSVANSALTLTATHQNPQTFDPTCPDPLQSGGNAGAFTSGMCSGHLGGQAFTFGYIEYAVERPTVVSGASWGAVWMLARNVIWPPEIDVNEWDSPGHAGTQDQAYFNHSSVWQTQYVTPYDSGNSYHVYGCHVTSTAVTWYRDGTQVYTATYDGVAEPWYPLFDYGVYEENTASGFPSVMNFDYVRVWVPQGVPATPVITVPISPSTGIASGGDITVSFGAVAGATSYRVTASATDSLADNFPNASSTIYSTTGSTSPLTVTGLPSGVRFNFTVCAINATGYSMESVPAGPQIINVQLTTLAVPNAVTGTAYSQTLSAQAGSPPYAWTISSGSLPAGLTLSTGGTISGTPTAAGTSDFTAKVSGTTAWTGSATVANSATQALSITVTEGGGGGGGGGTVQVGPGNTTLGWTSSPAADYALAMLEILPVLPSSPPGLKSLRLQAVKRASSY